MSLYEAESSSDAIELRRYERGWTSPAMCGVCSVPVVVFAALVACGVLTGWDGGVAGCTVVSGILAVLGLAALAEYGDGGHPVIVVRADGVLARLRYSSTSAPAELTLPSAVSREREHAGNMYRAAAEYVLGGPVDAVQTALDAAAVPAPEPDVVSALRRDYAREHA